MMPKYTLKFPDRKIAISGLSLGDCTQEQLEELYKSGDERFIAKTEEPVVEEVIPEANETTETETPETTEDEPGGEEEKKSGRKRRKKKTEEEPEV